jgi:lysine-N-methylase
MPFECIVSGQIQGEAGIAPFFALCRYQERRMRPIALFKPEYSESFRCIGPACEDSCCEEWTIHVDQSTFEKYKALPAGPLRTIVDENIQRISEETNLSNNPETAAFAQIRMTADRKCPLLSADGLCRMQAEHGEAFLSHMCATYPRVVSSIGGVTEKALSLSCPEAARLVLLNQRLATSNERNDEPPMRDEAVPGGDLWLPHFWPIRDFALGLLRNRTYPLWQRLFLIGLFSSRFDAIPPGDLRISAPQLLADFGAAVASQKLQASMETLPVDHAQQLDVVLRLAGMLLHNSNLHPRFLECIKAFTQGIGNGPGATLESLTACYAQAHDRYFAPFFEKHPYILENYLINTIFRCRFPFGREWARDGSAPSMSREFALLTAQFALIKGLLIGVAGFHREGLSTNDIVHTFQAASKHFEHHTEFLSQAHALLVESRMDGALGMATLLRNAESKSPTRPAVPADLPPAQRRGNASGATTFPVRRTAAQWRTPQSLV